MMIKPHVAVFKLALLVHCFIIPLLAFGHFYEEEPKGFLWYKDVANSNMNQKLNHDFLSKNSDLAQDARARNEKLSKDLDNAIQIMADKPNVENAIEVQRLQQQIIQRSEQVAKSWVLASLLDSGLLKSEDNQNVLHRELQKKHKVMKITAELKDISNDWGVIFYWRKNCIYCERFVPIVQELQDMYKFKILAVSEQGDDFGSFKGQKDTGLIKSMNPNDEAPLLFLVNKNGKEIYPIARGITDLEQIGSNILMVMTYVKGTEQ